MFKMRLKIILIISGLAFCTVECVVRTNVTGVLGREIVLPCTIPVDSHTKEWKSRKLGYITRNRSVLKQPERFSLLPGGPQSGDWSLKIVNISMDDEDSYHCTAGVYRTRVRLAVQVAPYFEGCHGDIKETVTRNVSETTTLVCEPKGIPTPDKTWYRVDQRNRNEMHLEGHGPMLTVLGEDIASEQSYLCVANNTHGHVTLSFTIKTLAPPRILSEHKPKKLPGFETPQMTTIPRETTSKTEGTTNMQNVTKSVTEKPKSSKEGAESSSSGTIPINVSPRFLIALLLYFALSCFLG